MQLWRKRPWLLRGLALVLSVGAALLPGWWAPDAVSGLEDRVGDLAWKLAEGRSAERRVVLVDIDERSLAEIGHWPWPRATTAELVDRLSAAEVRVLAFDIAFSDERADDALLQAAWAKTSTVVAQIFSIDDTVTPAVGVAAGPLAAAGCPAFAPRSFGFYGTASSLLSSQTATGHITPRIGADGVIREVPALICHEGRAYPSLALTTLWRASQPVALGAGAPGRGLNPDWTWHTAAEPSPYPAGLTPPAWLTSDSLPGWVVPLDAKGNMRVPYAVSRQAMVSVSAADLLKGRVDKGLLQGTVAVVGATAFGIGDTVATPLASVAAGLEVHVQSLYGLLDQRTPYTPAAWPRWQAGVLALIAAFLLLIGLRRSGVPAKRLPMIGVILAVATPTLAGVMQLQFALWLPWLPLAIFSLVASLSLATVEHALVRAQRERLSAHLGAYLPAPVATRLMASDPSGKLQLERRNICVLVADIRNFTAFATHCDPDDVASLLHAFCCLAVDVVERHGGVVENVVGDCVVAVWSDSADGAGSSGRAVAAAQDLFRQTQPLLASSHPVADVSPVQPLALGVGLEAGEAIVGSFGPARRRAHAALGEPVSVANRIQQMTADLSIPILIGPKLAAQLPGSDLEPLGDYLLEGLGKHYQLFAPVGWTDLAYVDSNWASSASGERSKPQDAMEWSRWGEGTVRSQTVGHGSGWSAVATILRRHSA